jgi:hypothetical protein
LGYFGDIFGFWDKKIMFGKKSDEKTIPCVKYGPICVFYFQNFHVFPVFLFSCFEAKTYLLRPQAKLF